jgi:hypothetical protein
VRAVSEGITESRKLEQLISHAVGRWTHHTYGRRPVISSVVISI